MSFNDLTMGFWTLISWLVLMGTVTLVAYMVASASRYVLRKSSRSRG